jgi:site-specific DNA recombinase
MIAKLGDMAAVMRAADPSDKSEVYQQMGLELTYQPGRKVVQGAIRLDAPGHWFFDGVRGGT